MNKKKYEENSIYSRFGLYLSLGAMAQQTLNGVVKDASGKPFPGVKYLEGRRIPYQQHYR